MKDIYAEKGYGAREIGFGERLGLLVVDFQRGFTDPEYRMGGSPHIEQAVKNTAKLLQVARAQGVPVASCYIACPKQGAIPFWKVQAVTEDLLEGSRSEEHTSELQSLMRTSYAVFCLTEKNQTPKNNRTNE